MNDLEGLSREFEKSLRLRYFKETTIKETMRQLADFIHCLSVCHGVREAEAVTREMIEAYQVRLYEHINSMGRPNGIACQNMTLGIVKRFMKFLKRNDYIVSDPAADISYARLPRRLPAGILSISEMRRILHAPDTKTLLGYRDRTMFEVLYSTGVRRSELGKLTLNDVDYHDGFLRINQGKGGKDRVVPLGRIACRYLENYIKSVRPELIRDPCNNHVFLSSRGAKLGRCLVWKLIKKYARLAKIQKNIHCHTFRHSCATAMLRNKADIRTIQELLGHASLESTQIYTHVTITDLKEVHRRCHPREQDKE